jgi:methyl-accepting chemotaxis protein
VADLQEDTEETLARVKGVEDRIERVAHAIERTVGDGGDITMSATDLSRTVDTLSEPTQESADDVEVPAIEVPDAISQARELDDQVNGEGRRSVPVSRLGSGGREGPAVTVASSPDHIGWEPGP